MNKKTMAIADVWRNHGHDSRTMRFLRQRILCAYNSMMETLHLLSTPANAAALARAIQQDKAGHSQIRELIDTGN